MTSKSNKLTVNDLAALAWLRKIRADGTKGMPIDSLPAALTDKLSAMVPVTGGDVPDDVPPVYPVATVLAVVFGAKWAEQLISAGKLSGVVVKPAVAKWLAVEALKVKPEAKPRKPRKRNGSAANATAGATTGKSAAAATTGK